jgi:ribosomal RNA-processing protein 1
MSDKPLVQQMLATDLAHLLLSIPTLEAAFEFLRGFWEALVREWSGLDRLRWIFKIDSMQMLETYVCRINQTGQILLAGPTVYERLI